MYLLDVWRIFLFILFLEFILSYYFYWINMKLLSYKEM